MSRGKGYSFTSNPVMKMNSDCNVFDDAKGIIRSGKYTVNKTSTFYLHIFPRTRLIDCRFLNVHRPFPREQKDYIKSKIFSCSIWNHYSVLYLVDVSSLGLGLGLRLVYYLSFRMITSNM
jgi:hypothetical protein